MLGLWLFGLVTGVANACSMPYPAPSVGVLEAAQAVAPKAAPAHDLAATQANDSGSGSMVAHDAGPMHHHHHHHTAAGEDEPPGLSNCMDFCGKAGLSIAPQKSVLDAALDHAMLQPMLTASRPAAAALAVLPWVPRQGGTRTRPVLMHSMRLAL